MIPMTFICCTAFVIKFPTNQNFHFCHVPDSFTYHIYLLYTSVYQSVVNNIFPVEEWYPAYTNVAGVGDFDLQSHEF